MSKKLIVKRPKIRETVTALRIMDPIALAILIERFGAFGHEPKSLEAIGDNLGITRERVRQREVRAIETLPSRKILGRHPKIKRKDAGKERLVLKGLFLSCPFVMRAPKGNQFKLWFLVQKAGIDSISQLQNMKKEELLTMLAIIKGKKLGLVFGKCGNWPIKTQQLNKIRKGLQ